MQSRTSPERVEVEDLLLSRVRMGVLSALWNGDEMEFAMLRDILELTDGNLSVHLRKLEEGELLKSRKLFVERKPKTLFCITPKGRKAFRDLVSGLENLIKSKP